MAYQTSAMMFLANLSKFEQKSCKILKRFCQIYLTFIIHFSHKGFYDPTVFMIPLFLIELPKLSLLALCDRFVNLA